MGIGFHMTNLFTAVMILFIAFMLMSALKGLFVRALAFVASLIFLPSMISQLVNRDLTFILTVLFAVVIVIIWTLLSIADSADRKRAQAMGAPDFYNLLEILSANPELAGAGWFKVNWLAWSPHQRMTWCQHHLVALRDLQIKGGPDGLRTHGNKLPMMLASLEHANPINLFPTQRSEA